MAKRIEIKEAPAKAKPEVEVATMIDDQTLEESYVYVHCYFNNTASDAMIRIWKTTFLIDRVSGSKSKLVHAENISFAPVWTKIPDGVTYSFLLIFTALPKSCQLFDLLEDIPQSGGFFVDNISRTETDVYHISLK
jgi:hypothetical protein